MPLYPHLTELFGSDQPFTTLRRPDNYVAAVGPGLDATPAQDWLAALFTK